MGGKSSNVGPGCILPEEPTVMHHYVEAPQGEMFGDSFVMVSDPKKARKPKA